MKIVITIGKIILEIIYFFMKLRPIQNRILFMSRQENDPSMDIKLLSHELKRRGYETEILCKTLNKDMSSAISYAFHMLKQMSLMSTSKVVVLDSYCIVACLLSKRRKSSIVQMWHALGSMKKFGYSIIDKPEGRSSEMAQLMKMHKNYDYIFTSSNQSRPYFAEAFGYDPNHLTVKSLPRVDALRDRKRDENLRKQIRECYPQLGDKPTILYAPTLRRGSDMTPAIEELIDAVDYSKYNLVIKLHPVASKGIVSDKAIVDKYFKTIDMFAIADYVITDYSALTYEAAIKGLPMYFYAYDHDEYMENVDFYLDYDKEMPGIISKSADKIMKSIEENRYDPEKLKRFADTYIEKQERCTMDCADFIQRLM